MLLLWSIAISTWICFVVGQQDDGGCTCVPFYRCNNGTIIINGEGIIDIRMKPEECPSYLETCCKKKNVIEASDVRQLPSPMSIKNLQCGKRHLDGIGYRIIGDDDNEAQFGEFPWMAAVFRKGRTEENYVYKCGGSLIHPQVVLTAAHCINGVDNHQIKVRLGEWDTQTRQEIFKHEELDIKSMVVHDRFSRAKLENDIGLLFLNNPVTAADHITPVCLPPQNFIASGEGCFVTGWGKENFEADGKYQAILKKIELPVMGRAACQKAFRGTRLGQHFDLHESFMCAGGEEGKDACTGDGGGPLVCPIENEEDRYYQVGIVAWGIGCGSQGIPGAYVDVAHFRSWIDRQIKMKNFEKSYEYS